MSCIICAKRLDNNSSSTKDINFQVDKQLAVIFFIQKFLRYPLIPAPGGDVKEIAQDVLSSMLIKEGNPANWLSFCPNCYLWVQEARNVYLCITEFEGKLNRLRKTVEAKVVETYSSSSSTHDPDSDISLFNRMRTVIFRESKKSKSTQLIRDDSDSHIGLIEVTSIKTEKRISELEEETEWSDNESEINHAGSCPENLEQFDDGFEVPINYEEEDLIEHSENIVVPVPDVPVRSRKSKKSAAESRTCQVCFRILDRPSYLSKHMKSHDADRRPGTKKSSLASRTCPICQKVCDRPSFMNRHLRSHIVDGSIPCNTCGLEFTSKEDFLVHYRETHSNNEISITQTENDYAPETTEEMEVVGFETEIEDNEEQDVNQENLTITNIGKGGRHKSDLVCRVCPVCEKVCDRPSVLHRHLRSHIKNGPIPCTICNMKFSNIDDYPVHVKIHVNNPDDSINC